MILWDGAEDEGGGRGRRGEDMEERGRRGEGGRRRRTGEVGLREGRERGRGSIWKERDRGGEETERKGGRM